MQKSRKFALLDPTDDLFQTFTGGDVVYLIHLTKPLQRKGATVAHYIGFTADLSRRLAEHIEHRNGSPLIHAALERGSGLIVAAVWSGVNRLWEKFLKRRKNTRAFCPICHGKPAAFINEPMPF
jgi:hypothetical protein